MPASELDKAVAYTKQFIEAATPIAKQAYEIGLMTLRIDAAQGLFYAAVMLIASMYILRRLRNDWATAKATAALPKNAENIWRRDPDDHLIAGGALHFFTLLTALTVAIISASVLLNIWNWTRLFAPQFWLAHQAVQKLVN